MVLYEPSKIEPYWQKWWEEQGTFVASDDFAKPKFYALSMFPYPSGLGLHMGHPASYIPNDIMARKRRAEGFNVLHPMGYDAFGLPAEQKAIETGRPPQELTDKAVTNFRRQLKLCGFSYDWTREISTADPSYYKWTQWIFTQLYNAELADESEMYVNWCEALGTVLSNDEVIDGRSERGDHPVERVLKQQWKIRITKYAEKLLEGLDRIDWPESTKHAQRERIGRSEGAEITFPIMGCAEQLVVFTTRPDTLWGATYMVMAPEHPLVERITPPEKKEEVEAYQRRTASMSEIDRQKADKTGVDIGAKAINPANNEEIPIWIADYVIYGYGTGAIMAVPAHDERDWAFAKTMNLPIVEVISGGNVQEQVHSEEGEMVNSGAFDGTPTADGEAVKKVTAWLEQKGTGKGLVQYSLRDWIFARQRYWGEPIPVLKKEDRVVRTLDTSELPLVLPQVDDYSPLGKDSPLAGAREWMEVDDPQTGERMMRESDTMPGSAGSSWYFLRYCDPNNEEAFCSREKSDYWMPVDLYIGGPEHAVGHLMYSRMWQRALFDLGFVRDDEPCPKLRHQGMIKSFTYYEGKKVVPLEEVEEREGKHFKVGTDIELDQKVEKMAKRKGNVVNPDDVIRDFGADAMRIYLCFLGPLDQDKPWDPQGIEAQSNFLKRFWRLFFHEEPLVEDSDPSEAELKVLHKTIKKVSGDIEKLHFNTAISALHVATRDLKGSRSRQILAPLAQLIAPFAPHIAEEIWQKGLGHEDGISFAPWPKHDEALAKDDLIKMGVQVMGKTRGEIEIPPKADEETAMAAAKANDNVTRHLEGKEITRVIYKPGRILNIIAK